MPRTARTVQKKVPTLSLALTSSVRAKTHDAFTCPTPRACAARGADSCAGPPGKEGGEDGKEEDENRRKRRQEQSTGAASMRDRCRYLRPAPRKPSRLRMSIGAAKGCGKALALAGGPTPRDASSAEASSTCDQGEKKGQRPRACVAWARGPRTAFVAHVHHSAHELHLTLCSFLG